jgi:hypothetical protein
MSHTPTPFIRGATDLPLARRAEVGGVVVHLLEAGLQRLDGGAMFGVVPKPLWERRIPADERNRIPLAMRCTLFETGGELVLVETGLGNKESEKFTDIYGVENAGTALEDPDRLHSAIRAAGYSADDVTLVINTHLHFDHAGGNTFRGGDGEVRPAFPNARYLVQRGEWEYAHDTNERTAASYLPPQLRPRGRGGAAPAAGGRFRDPAGAVGHLHPRPLSLPPVRAAADGAGHRLHPCRRRPDHGAPAPPLDHGVRRGAAPYAGVEAVPPAPRRRRGLAPRLRARPRGAGRPRPRGAPGRRDRSRARPRLGVCSLPPHPDQREREISR